MGKVTVKGSGVKKVDALPPDVGGKTGEQADRQAGKARVKRKPNRRRGRTTLGQMSGGVRLFKVTRMVATRSAREDGQRGNVSRDFFIVAISGAEAAIIADERKNAIDAEFGWCKAGSTDTSPGPRPSHKGTDTTDETHANLAGLNGRKKGKMAQWAKEAAR